MSTNLVSVNFKVHAKEREIQQTRDIQEDFNCRIQDVSERMNVISMKLKERATDVELAKEEARVRCQLHYLCIHDLDHNFIIYVVLLRLVKSR